MIIKMSRTTRKVAYPSNVDGQLSPYLSLTQSYAVCLSLSLSLSLSCTHTHTLRHCLLFSDDDADTDGDENDGKLNAEYVEKLNFGGFERMENTEQREKSRREIMSEIIAKSKQRKVYQSKHTVVHSAV